MSIVISNSLNHEGQSLASMMDGFNTLLLTHVVVVNPTPPCCCMSSSTILILLTMTKFILKIKTSFEAYKRYIYVQLI